jgi:hypothetical protein
MVRCAGILSLLAVPIAMFIAFVIAEPQLQLRGRIWAGELRTRAVPVVDFEAPAVAAKSRTLRLDCLSFRVPADEPEAITRVSEGCVWISTAGLTGLVFGPITAEAMISPADYLDVTRLPKGLTEDPAGLRAAAYAAGADDLSVWMSPEKVDLLTALLEAKTMLCASATRVEWVKSPRLSGVLIIRDCADSVYLTLEYFSSPEGAGGSADGPVCGMASLMVDLHSPRAMNLARSIVSSFEIN